MSSAIGEDGSALVSKEKPAIAGDIADGDIFGTGFMVVLGLREKSSREEGVVSAVKMSEGAVEVESLSEE
jgi:hypothetical protein